ncbi:MAG: cbb3-type cytochrome oxidase assembly protein CcoS [Pseudomonadota bacterium]
MDSLYLLIPLSIVLVIAIGGLLAWSVLSGQFDDLDAEGRRILDEEDTPRDDASGSDG